jgi:hypothetical protein
MGTNNSGQAIDIQHAGTGDAIDIEYAGTGFALDINITNSGGEGIEISSAVATGELLHISQTGGSGPLIQCTRSGSATGLGLFISFSGTGTNHCIRLDNSSSSSSSDSIEINHSGAGRSIDLNHTATGAVPAIDLDYAGSNHALDIFCSSLTSSHQALVISETSSVSNVRNVALVQVTASGTGVSGNIAEFNGQGGSFFDIHDDCSVRIHTNLAPADALVVNNPDSGTGSGETLLVLAANASTVAGHRWMECIGSGSNITFRIDDGGATYNDQGIYSSPADYAENFTPKLDKSNYAPGDVIIISGADEVDKSSAPNQTAVLGVYSTQPAFLGNSGPDGGDLTGGTLEAASWAWEQSKGPRSSYDKLVIAGDRTADYAVDSMVRMDGSNTAMTVLTVSHNVGLDETTVTFDQTWINDPLGNGPVDLYHTVPERQVIPVGLLGQIPTKCITENGTINPGDLLVTSSTAGYAMKAGVSPAAGTIIGKALGTVTDVDGTQTDTINCFINPM